MRLVAQEVPATSVAAAIQRLAPNDRVLAGLYERSEFRPLWTTEEGRLTQQGEAVLTEMAAADTRGLSPADYDAALLRERASALASEVSLSSFSEGRARFDVAMSRAVIRFMQHLQRGRVNPRALGFALPADDVPRDFAALTLALAQSTDVDASLLGVEPRFSRYKLLKRVLANYRRLVADTTLRAPRATATAVKPGSVYSGTAALRRFLVAVGDLAPDSLRSMAENARTPTTEPSVYAGPVVDAVRAFQRRHGLLPDGVLGAGTFAALRVPLAERVTQIELSLERWRWLPSDTARRRVVVNIPAFHLLLFDQDSVVGRPVLTMDVIVGSAYRRRKTPIFVGTMRDVVFAPYWDVPNAIARHETIPAIRRDRDYATREGFEIVRGDGEDARTYPITEANLQRVASGVLRLRQRPGAANALGPIKFIFPNEYNVYLHGTPAQALFAEPRRDFSHGCIRVSDPAALAEFVLDGQDGWDRARIDSTMRDGQTLSAKLAHELPVAILYTTVVPDDSGEVFFYPDIYGHDARLERALATASARLRAGGPTPRR